MKPKLVASNGPARGRGSSGDPPVADYVTHAEFQDFRHETGERFARIETRLEQTATKEDVSAVKAEIHRGIVETQRWMIATVIGLFIGFGGLFMAMTNALKPVSHQAAAPSQPPIIINVPAAAPPAPPATPQ